MAREATLRAVFAIEERILATVCKSPEECGERGILIPLVVKGPAAARPLSSHILHANFKRA